MTNDEQDRLARIERDVKKIKNRDYAGGFTGFMVFMMWFVFLLHGCNFK